MTDSGDKIPPAQPPYPAPGQQYPPPAAPPGGYPPPAPGQQYAAPQYAPPPPMPQAPAPKKGSVAKKVLAVLVVIVLAVAVKVGVRAVLNRNSDNHASHINNGFDYPVGTCLNLSKAGIVVKPSDVKVEPCSSPTALSRVAKKYNGAKNCPNANYGTLEGGGSGLCLEDNLVVDSCYHQALISHMFAATACKPGVLSNDQTFRVALRRDGVDDPGLCTEEQQAVTFPEPPLTYCMDVLVSDQ